MSHFTGKTGAQDRLEAVRPFQREEENEEDDGEEDAAGRGRGGAGGEEGEDSDDNWGFGDDNGGKGSGSGGKGSSGGERGGVVMLIALKAGGAGLNLPFASHVWMMEPHWNPYMEDQVRTDEEMTRRDGLTR